MYQIEPDITPELILANVSQEEIFEHYLNIRVQLNVLFTSPLRSDEHPTCNFNWYRGVLYFRDWSEPQPKDCFNIVQELFNCDFYQALTIIKTDLLDGKDIRIPSNSNAYSSNNRNSTKNKSSKKRIRVSICKFHSENIEYLQQYGITSKQTTKFNVFSIDKLWVDGKLMWTYNRKDPCLAYYFGKSKEGEQRWKIYFYKRDEYRFIGNTNRINGSVQIPEKGEQLIITKSLKDVMCLDRLNIPAIAMQNEVTIPYDYIIENLETRFDQIYSFYDFDRTGVVNANKLKKIYNIPYIFLTNGKFKTTDYKAKDISDFIMERGLREAQRFLSNCGIRAKIT